ncbi:MAG: RNA polymerase sigma factor [Blastocatellia bacterium]
MEEAVRGTFWTVARNYESTKARQTESMKQDLSKIADEDLLREMLAGSEDALIQLYRRRQGSVFRFALQMTGSESVAEDVTQEAFMTLMRAGKNYSAEKGSVAAFLFGIARNHVYRRLGSDRPYVAMPEDNEIEFAESEAPGRNPMSELVRNEEIRLVRSAVASLPVHYREVVVLCELHEVDYVEAAGILGCPVGTVRSRLHRARKLLLEKLKTDEPDHRNGNQVRPARYLA